MKTRATLSLALQQTLNVTLVLLVLLGTALCKDGSSRDQTAPRTQDSKSKAGLPQGGQSQTGIQDTSTADRMLGAQGLVFIENRGQFDRRAKFLVKGHGTNLWLTDDGIVFDLQRPLEKESAAAAAKSSTAHSPSLAPARLIRGMKAEPPQMERLVFKQKLVGAAPNATIEAHNPQPGIYNYFIGSDPEKWTTHVVAYREVTYRDIWKGVDLKLSAKGANLEEEFIVHPGADPNAVQVAYEGIQGLTVSDDGSLRVATAFGDITETTPRIYQENSGQEVRVSGKFKVVGSTYSFAMAKRDEHADLIIDPTVLFSEIQREKRSHQKGKRSAQGTLLYSSFLGGSQADQGNAIAVDTAGNAYVVGTTASTDFPTTPGAFQTSGTGVFVTKVNALGSALVYSTYLGQGAYATGIAVDSSGEAYVVGGNASAGFPTTANAYSGCGSGGAFLTKLTAGGNALIYSTCLPGAEATSVAIDSGGNAYMTGGAGYPGSLPTTPNAFQSQFKGCGGYSNAFFSVFNPSASGAASLTYSTYLGATGYDCNAVTWGDGGLAVTVDAYGMAYVTGLTAGPDFPVTAGAYLTTFPGTNCYTSCELGGSLPSAFIAKIDAQSSGAASLIYSTFLGGSAGTLGNGIAVDPLGNAYVAGATGYNEGLPDGSAPFPTTPGAYQTAPDYNDAFVTKLNAAGNNLIYSTLLGGEGAQGATSIALDTSNEAYVTGWPAGQYFPTTPNAFLPNDPNWEWGQAFVTQFNSTGTALIYSSFLGGATQQTNGYGIAVDQVGDAYVTGSTLAIDFPVTSYAFQPLYAGNGDAFVTKFPIGAPSGISITAILPNAGGNAGQVTAQIYGTGFHAGATAQLKCSGGPVYGQNVTVTAGGQLLGAIFNLTASSPGTCDVQVTNPDQTSATLRQGFTVQQGGAPNIQVQKTGTLAIKGDNPPINVTYVIAVSNMGNVDFLQSYLSELITCGIKGGKTVFNTK